MHFMLQGHEMHALCINEISLGPEPCIINLAAHKGQYNKSKFGFIYTFYLFTE